MSIRYFARCAAVLVVGVLAGALAAQEKEPPPEQLPVAPAEEIPAPREIVYPKGDAVAELLKKEPLTVANWPTWRARLLEWIDDPGTGTDAAFVAGRKFAKEQADAKGELPDALAKDYLAWYLLGNWHLFDASGKTITKEIAQSGEQALRRSIALNDKFAQAHRNLALALLYLERGDPGKDEEKISPRFRNALNEIQEANRLNPKLSLAEERALAGQIAGEQDRATLADILLLQALTEKPALAPEILSKLGVAVLLNRQRDFANTEVVLGELAKKFPNDGAIHCLLGVAQLANFNPEGAASLAKGRALGADPEKVVPASSVLTAGLALLSSRTHSYAQADDVLQVFEKDFPHNAQIPVMRALALAAKDSTSEAPTKSWRDSFLKSIASALSTDGNMEAAERQLEVCRSRGGDPVEIGAQVASVLRVPKDWVHGVRTEAMRQRFVGNFKLAVYGAAGVYAVVMLLMFFVGPQLGKQPAAAATPSAVGTAQPPAPPTGSYALALRGGLALFHILALLLLVALMALGAGLLFLLLSSPQMDFKYLCALIVVGILAWVYLSMVFSPRARERVGIAASKLDNPRLFDLVHDVAQKTDAEPLGDVRLAPGTAVGVRMNSWGPLGLFGKQPVLILGMTTLRLLNVGELRALLAQQLIQFSKREDGGGRTVYRGLLRANDSMSDVWSSGGAGNYVNPFYLLFSLYHKALGALAKGFTWNRALEADRDAAALEGGAALESAIDKATIDAPILDGKMRQLAKELVTDAPDLSNLYAAWDDLCGPQRDSGEKEYAHLVISAEDFARSRQQVRGRQNCIRADRLAQVSTLPRGSEPDQAAALKLFDNLESVEEQLTEIVIAPLLAGRNQRQGAGVAAR